MYGCDCGCSCDCGSGSGCGSGLNSPLRSASTATVGSKRSRHNSTDFHDASYENEPDEECRHHAQKKITTIQELIHVCKASRHQ
jgi:hypothetical protein